MGRYEDRRGVERAKAMFSTKNIRCIFPNHLEVVLGYYVMLYSGRVVGAWVQTINEKTRLHNTIDQIFVRTSRRPGCTKQSNIGVFDLAVSA